MRKTISTALIAARPQELGKIKIGGKGEVRKSKKGDDYSLPVKYDHFVVTGRTRGEDGNFEKDNAIHAIIGDEPLTLDCVCAFDTVEESFQSVMQVYEGKTLVFRCDGETAENMEKGEEQVCPRIQGGTCPCKPYGRLAVMLEAAREYGGFHVFRTTSWESVANIQSTLGMLERQFGSLRGIPLRLKLYETEVRYEENGSPKVGTAWVVGVVLRASFEEARSAAIEYHQSAQLIQGQLKALSAGTTEMLDAVDVEEEADFAEEFHPEPPPDEDEPEASDERPEWEPSEYQVRELRALMERAAKDDELLMSESETWEKAIEVNDGDAVRAAIVTLSQRLKAPDPAQGSML